MTADSVQLAGVLKRFYEADSKGTVFKERRAVFCDLGDEVGGISDPDATNIAHGDILLVSRAGRPRYIAFLAAKMAALRCWIVGGLEARPTFLSDV